MKVDFMRKVDYYAGIPLAFILTPVVRVTDLFRRKQARPKNVLFIELSEMGSTILVDPAMQKLKKEAGANLYFVIFKKNKPSLKLLNTVPEENIFTINESGLVGLAVDTLRFLYWTRKNRIDTVIDLELFSRFTALMTGLSGAVNRIGFYSFHNEGLYRGEMLTRRVAYNPFIHISKNFIALINTAISEKPEVPYSKTVVTDAEIQLQKASYSDAELQTMRGLVKEEYPAYDASQHKIVLVNPNASELLPQRRWMPERYIELAKKILGHDSEIIILLTGAPSEREEAAAMANQVGSDRCVNFAGKLKLVELPVLYSISRLMITNDSGPGHFSAITDMPTLVLFGPETPALYGSLGNSEAIYAGLACSPCVSAWNHRKTPCTDNVCLQAITVEQVFDRARGYL